MTQPIRFLFDECISRPAVETQVRQSLALYGAQATVAHFLGKYPMGTKDRVWIPEIAQEGGWIIVSMDRGRHSRKSERLPVICRAFRVTHVMLSPGLEKRNTYYRVLAVESCWQDLIAAGCAPPGTGFVLAMHQGRSSASFRLQRAQEALPPEDASFVQQELQNLWDSE